MHLLVTRPEPDASALADMLLALGHEVLVAPVMQVVVREFSIDLSGVQAVLFTSANGVRAFAEQIGVPPNGLTAFAVGKASAQVARDAGWTRVEAADGDVDALAALVTARLSPKEGPLIHVSGKAAAGDLAGTLNASGFTVNRVVGYEARLVDTLPETIASGLSSGDLDGVLLFSPRSARVLADLAEKAGLSGKLAAIDAYCLSPAVADALTARISAPNSINCKVATVPETPHLIALLSP
ncbi:MAG: uroporphyrinogen-III synthase [Pseudomonadota bacterium]